MGEVFLGHDTVLDRPVAVKFITNLDVDPQTRERYLIEARAAARLQHPNVVTIYRVGEIDAHPYIIAEYIQGQDLQALPKPVPWQFGLTLAVGLARGLAAAHKRGVLHRDLKPANAILADNGEVKLLDFGLAKYVDRPESVAVRWSNKEVVAPTMEATESGHFSPLAADPGRSAEGPVRVTIANPAAAAQFVPLPAAFPAVVQSDDRFHPVNLQDGQSLIPQVDFSRSSQIKGTPIYMAPERLLGAPATRRSDVYSMGALLYELLAGAPPHYGVPFEKLPLVVPEQDAVPLSHLAPSVDAQFAQVVDRCLKRNPAERYTSGEELQTALELCEKGKHLTALPDGNPYRGMLPYDSDHRALLFGRRGDLGTLIDRLRTESVVVLAGDGGCGKTSLVRAGLLPLIGEGAIGEGRRWRTVTTQPGRHPIETLSEALAEALGPRVEQTNLLEQLVSNPEAVRALLHKRTTERRGLVLLVDQLEELTRHGAPKEAQTYLHALSTLFEKHAGLRLILVVESQSIGPLAQLVPDRIDFGKDVYFLRPLSKDRLREVIVEPAHHKGVRFSLGLVDELLEFSLASESSLPLLAVVLAELWDAKEEKFIGTHSLKAISGITGAVCRHADHVLGSLPKERRTIARKLFLLLREPQPSGEAVCRKEEDLLAVHPDAGRVLTALGNGRLLARTETPKGTGYRVSHPMLLQTWPTMLRWAEEQTEPHQAKAAPSKPPVHTPRQRFVRLWWAVVPTLLLFATLFAVDFYRQTQMRKTSDKQTESARQKIALAKAKQALSVLYQKQALEMLDGPQPQRVSELWDLAKRAASQAERLFGQASQELERVVILAPNQPDLRNELAGVLFERALLAEWLTQTQLLEDLLRRIELYDQSVWIKRWHGKNRLFLRSEPPGAAVSMQRYVLDAYGQWTLGEQTTLGKTPINQAELGPGSYLFRVSLPGRKEVRLPIVLGHSEEIDQHVKFP